MDEKQLKEFQENFLKELGVTMDTVLDEKLSKKLEELNADNEKTIEDMKAEIKKFASLVKKQEANTEEKKKEIVASIFQKTFQLGIDSEDGFKSLVDAEVKALNEWTDADGWFAVFDQFESDIIREMEELSPIVWAIRWFKLKKGDKVSFPTVTNGITTAYVDEGTSWTASKPTFGRVTIDIYKTFTLVDLTEELLTDYMAKPDLYKLLVEFIAESQYQFLEQEILNGTGTGTSKVVGIRNLTGNKTYELSVQKTADITYDDVINAEAELPRKYRLKKNDVAWIMPDYVYFQLRKVKTADGYPLFPELNRDKPKLDLFNVIISDEAGDVVSASTDVAGAESFILGNIKKFYGVRRTGMVTKKGYYGDNWTKDVSSIKTNQRIGLKAVREDAFVVIKNKA